MCALKFGTEVTCGNKYGWLFRNGDADDLARQIRMVVQEKEQALHKVEAGCRYIHDTYDVTVTARKYLEHHLYR